MQKTDHDEVAELVARYAESRLTTEAQVAVRRDIVAALLKLRKRTEVAELLQMAPQRVSEIVGGVRGK